MLALDIIHEVEDNKLIILEDLFKPLNSPIGWTKSRVAKI